MGELKGLCPRAGRFAPLRSVPWTCRILWMWRSMGLSGGQSRRSVIVEMRFRTWKGSGSIKERVIQNPEVRVSFLEAVMSGGET